MKRISALGVVLCGLALTAAAEAASPAQCSDYAQREAEYAAPTGSGLVRGGARGAAGGALFGAIAGDAGKGAAIGAIVGGVARGARNQGVKSQVYQDAYNNCMQGGR
jgi:OmpA family protein